MYKFVATLALVLSVQAQAAETSFWGPTVTPAMPQATTDTQPVTLGVRFSSTQAGSVVGVRFYKGTQNTGTHVGVLWSSSGAKLATVVFSGETASGWQRANFSAPVNISANTTYVISYFAPKGAYALQQWYPWTGFSSGSLRAAGDAAGVYTYGSTASFPTSSYKNSNYFVDVVFSAGTVTPPPATTTYSISGAVSGSPATISLSGPVSGTKVTDSTGKYSFTGLPNGVYVLSASQSGYTFLPSTTQVTLNGASATAATFTGTPVSQTTTKSVSLSWAASTSPNIRGYNVYRADVAGGAYVKRNASPVGTTTYLESVTSGRTYYYVATAVDSNNLESVYSANTVAVVP